MRFARRTYAALLLGATLWCALLLLPPFLTVAGNAGRTLSTFVFGFFHLLCHQLDDRSFHVHGVPLAVCSRCASVYMAFLAGTIAYPVLRDVRHPEPAGRVLAAIAVLPMLLDLGLGMAGMHDVTNASRAITGGWFGLLIPFLVIPGTIEGVALLLSPSPAPMPPPMKGSDDA
jgi:uncharacterized membrane protein